MKCAIIAVGTELLFGNVVNTNAAYISQELNELGIDVIYHYTMGDNPERLKRTLAFASEDCDLIICSGGLGPTEDDLTKETVCEHMGVSLVYSKEAEEVINRLFARNNNFRLTQNNLKQAYVPEGAEIFQNTQGTAPGFAIEKNGQIVICVPGVPREMKAMFTKSVKPYLMAYMNAFIVSDRIQLFGMGESMVETRLLDLIDAQTDPTIATYAKEGIVEVRVTSKRETEEEARQAVNEMTKAVIERVGTNVFSTQAETLQNVVMQKLQDKGITLSCAEIPTAGMFASFLTDYPGAAEVFDRSFVLYSAQSIADELNIDQALVDEFTPCSMEVSKAMAEAVFEKTGSRMCAAITGTAGNEGYENVRPGVQYMSILFDGTMYTREFQHFGWTPRLNREYMVNSLLDMIDHILENREYYVPN